MSLGDIIILAALFLWLLLSLRYMRKRRKNGKCIGCPVPPLYAKTPEKRKMYRLRRRLQRLSRRLPSGIWHAEADRRKK